MVTLQDDRRALFSEAGRIYSTTDEISVNMTSFSDEDVLLHMYKNVPVSLKSSEEIVYRAAKESPFCGAFVNPTETISSRSDAYRFSADYDTTSTM